MRARAFAAIAAGLGAFVLLMTPPVRADSVIKCVGPWMPGCRFTVSGKKGTFLSRVDPARLNLADAAMVGGDGKGLAEHSLNRGEFSRTGLPMPGTTERLEALVIKLKAGWPYRDPGPIKVHIVGDTTYGARAQPDNTIVVPLGLLERATTDDEVAWVLAHEFSHVALRHYARTAELAKRKHGVEQLERLAETGLDISQERVAHNGLTFQFYSVADPETAKRRDAAWSRSQQLRQILLLSDSLASREQEDEADANGFDLAAAAGYAADEGANTALKVVEEDDKRAKAAAHTLEDQMKAGLTQSVSGTDVARGFNGDVTGALGDISGKLMRKAVFWGMGQMIGFLSENHRPAQVRIKGLSAYADAAYPTQAPRDSTTTWLTALRSSSEFQEASVVVNARDKAMADLAGGDPKQALADLQPGLTTRYSHTPLVLNVEAKAYDGLGDFAHADSTYEIADHAGLPPPRTSPSAVSASSASSHGRRGKTARAAPPPPPPAPVAPAAPFVIDPYNAQSLGGYYDHVVLLVSHGDFARATAKIAEAEHRFGDHERFLPAMIAIAVRTHDNKALMADFDECFATEDEALRIECRDAVYDDNQKKMLDSLSPEDRAALDEKIERATGEASRANWLKQITPQAPTDAAKAASALSH